MAGEYEIDFDTVAQDFGATQDDITYQTDFDVYWPYPAPGGVQVEYLQACWDTSESRWVHWKSTFKDIYGSQYPGTTFDSGTYKVYPPVLTTIS